MNKKEQYKQLLPQIESLIKEEDNVVGILANVAAALHETFSDTFFWVGFYLKKDAQQLILGPFQGSVACYRIPYGKGVCGKSWEEGKTLIVPNVDEFPGHIACSSLSKSEIVVPMFDSEGELWAVLDVDSKALSSFDTIDKEGLEAITSVVMNELNPHLSNLFDKK